MKHDVEMRISQLHQQTKTYVNEIKNLINEYQQPTKVNMISYFTYSLNISHDPEQESLCLGSYHIHNIGNQPLLNPYFCLTIPEDSPFSFSGRYVYHNFKQSLKNAGEWERLNDKTNTEEFWLKPLNQSSIEPNEILSFSNFQIKWSPTKPYAGSIMGFTYCDQFKEGLAVINPINLNGSLPIQEEKND